MLPSLFVPSESARVVDSLPSLTPLRFFSRARQSDGKALATDESGLLATGHEPRVLPKRKPKPPNPKCNYQFSEAGLKVLVCMEGVVNGCYMDSRCLWTLFVGHLAQDKDGNVSYEKCCELLNSGTTAEALLKIDVTAKVAAVIRNLNKHQKYCKGGKQALTQGQFDALVTATYQGAVFPGDYGSNKAGLLRKVRARTLDAGKQRRLDLFDGLWNGTPAKDCKPVTSEPGNERLQKTCLDCVKKTPDTSDDGLCERAKNKDCSPTRAPTDAPTASDPTTGAPGVGTPSGSPNATPSVVPHVSSPSGIPTPSPSSGPQSSPTVAPTGPTPARC